MRTLLDGRLIVMKGDITEMRVDAIVNAANSTLLGGGGVDGAIHRRGGPEILAACRRIREESYPGGMPAGNAVITTGGRLPSPWVIHTVGPVWRDGTKGEPEILRNAYLNSLELASRRSLRTIAFPAISTGVYRYPRDRAALSAYGAIEEHLRRNKLPEKVYLVFFSEEGRRAFLSAVGARSGEENPSTEG